MASVDQIVEQLRAQGERLTLQRRMVLEVLCEQGDHLAVHDIQQDLNARGHDLTETTVYRILQWLKERGVVSQTDLGHSGIVYQVIGLKPHHHLVCLNCQQVIDIDDSIMEILRARLREEYQFDPRIDHMAFFGVCQVCRASQPLGDR
jgi:Fur family ferric uptake transcriptional regulator